MARAILVAASLFVIFPAKADSESLTIGVLATLEGAFEPLGRDALRGHELALAEHEGHAGGLRIEALVESTDGSQGSVIAKARLLIENGASVLIGPLAGIESIALRDFAKTVPEVTFINGASAAQDATLRAPAENYFRFNPDSMQWIAGLGRYAYEEKDVRSIVTIAEDYSLPYTQLMGFMLDYCALGGRVVARHWVSPGASDAARLAETVAGTEADALFLALEPRAAERFLEAYGEADGQAAIVTGSTTLSGGLLRKSTIRPLLEGAISALPVSESDDNDELASFTERYRERYPDAGPAPSLFALSYYVNTKALLLALDETDGTLGEGQESLREALAELQFETPFGGRVELDENRQAVTENFIIEVVEEDDTLTQEVVHTVSDVGQTFGLSLDTFLAIGPPSRDTARCLELAPPDAEARPTPAEPEPQPTPPETEDEAAVSEAKPEVAEPEVTEPEVEEPEVTEPEVAEPEVTEPEVTEPETEEAADIPAVHPLLKSEEDAAMTGAGPEVIPCLSYRDAPKAVAWLKEAFGFTENFVVPGPDDTIAHAQLAFGTGMIMVGSVRDDELQMRTPCDLGGITQSIYVVVDNVDAHYAQAVLSGAEVVHDLEDTPYGSREYSARDPEGHLWNFGTYRPTIGE